MDLNPENSTPESLVTAPECSCLLAMVVQMREGVKLVVCLFVFNSNGGRKIMNRLGLGFGSWVNTACRQTGTHTANNGIS